MGHQLIIMSIMDLIAQMDQMSNLICVVPYHTIISKQKIHIQRIFVMPVQFLGVQYMIQVFVIVHNFGNVMMVHVLIKVIFAMVQIIMGMELGGKLIAQMVLTKYQRSVVA